MSVDPLRPVTHHCLHAYVGRGESAVLLWDYVGEWLDSAGRSPAGSYAVQSSRLDTAPSNYQSATATDSAGVHAALASDTATLRETSADVWSGTVWG